MHLICYEVNNQKTIIMNKFALYLLLFMSMISFSSEAKEKSERIKPSWIKNTPVSNNSRYSFEVILVENGKDLASSRIMAKAELTRCVEKKFDIQVSESINEISATEQHNNDTDKKNKVTYILDVKSDNEQVTVYCERVDEYYEIYQENGVTVFKLYTLFAVSNVGEKAMFDDFRVTAKYGAKGLWRSAICPGWGQMYKGSMAKGISILAAEVAAIGGIIFTENERASYETKMRSQPKFAQKYKTKVDNYETARNCCIGAAAAIYVYNIIDAIVASGARRVVVTPKKLQINPILSEGFSGFKLSYNF